MNDAEEFLPLPDGCRPLKRFHVAQLACAASIFVCSFFLCSCTTEPTAHRSLPEDVAINKDAGRGSLLIVTVRLESGQKLPFIVDTGAGGTLIDKSLESKLGKPAGTTVLELAGVTCTNNYYAAPKLYLGGAPLTMTGPFIIASDLGPISSAIGCRVKGILGMDVWEHYCLQLDFAAGKMRFPGGDQADKQTWGRPFPIVPLNAEDTRPGVAENLFGAQGPLSLIDSGFAGDGWLMPAYFRQWTNAAVLPATGEAHSPDARFGGERYPMISLPEKDFPSDGIGLNFLARHRVTLDFPNHTLYLQRQSIGPLPDPKMDEFKPIPDKEPKVTAHLRAVIQDMIAGTAQADDYTADAWKNLASKQKAVQAETRRFGDFAAMTLVDRRRAGGRRSYRYRVEFAKATLLARFVFDGRGKLASGQTEAVVWKEMPE
jgi:hypothetical protein